MINETINYCHEHEWTDPRILRRARARTTKLHGPLKPMLFAFRFLGETDGFRMCSPRNLKAKNNRFEQAVGVGGTPFVF